MSSGLEQNDKREEEESGRKEGRRRMVGASVQRMLYASVSAVDGCCSVLARQRLGEKEEEGRKERKDATKITQIKNNKAKKCERPLVS